MTEENSKLVNDLNQIKANIERELDGLGGIKDKADAEILSDLEKIERQGWQTVLEIDELKKKINQKDAGRFVRRRRESRQRTSRPSGRGGRGRNLLIFFCD